MKIVNYALLFAFFALVMFLILPVDRSRLHPGDLNSIQICDRNGALLREVLSFDYKTSVWVPLEQISPWMITAALIREDKRFLFHCGVDLVALGRATINNVRQGRVVSGGSTITMQVAKMALRLRRRTLINKIIEIVYALKLELHLSKQEIMEIYLNQIPYGNQTYGIEAAARLYFEKNADQLSLGESCVLALVPKAPSVLNPYSAQGLLTDMRRDILARMHRAGLVNDFECQIAIDEPLHLVDKKLNFEAPHFVDYVLSQLGDGKDKAVRIVTTLDLGLQKDLQRLLSTTLESMKDYHVTQGAIIVMNAKSGEILAMIGSRDYFDGVEGQVNGCISSRQPGSSIKPFLYALAIQSGMRLSDMLPDTLIEFRLGDGTAFTPRNYGHRYHGPTRMREALASSFNVPAVYLIEQLGVHRFYELLKRLGFRGLDKDAAHYGLALSLGAAEVTLLELVNAYRVFAMEGNFNEAQALRAEYDQQGRQIRLTEHAAQRIFSIETAYLITDMLSDNAARFKAFDIDNALHLPFACAVKTGTSKDYRDNWCVGHTNKFAVGVWVGNFTGAPMQGVSGISGAAPLFRSVMLELHRDDDPGIFRCPETLVRRSICARSGKLAGSGCTNLIEETFIAGSEPRDTCTIHIRPGERRMHMAQHRAAKSTARQGIIILAPTPGDIYRIDPHVSRAAQQIRFRAASSSDEITRVIVKIDGKYLVTQNLPFEYLWTPSSGNHELQVIDQGNVMRSSAVEFMVN